MARKPKAETNTWGPLVWDDGTVLGSFACPECDNDVAAKLLWIDRERVRCAECGTEYDPFRGWLGADDLEVPDAAQA